jgi:hypothetical protein
MGGAYTFVGSQYRLIVGTQEYFIDLLLFHRRLRRLIAIELKSGEFKPEYKGKMEFYLEALETDHKYEGEDSPMGIIICRDKERTVVEYALRTSTRPMGVATYSVVSELPEGYQNDLPTSEEIAKRLMSWEDEDELNKNE